MSARKADKITILALSVHQEMGEQFVRDVCGSGMETQIDDLAVSMDVLAGDPRLNAAWDDTVKNAQGVVLLARFLDVISLDKLKAIYRRLPSDDSVPVAIFIVRENEETDFKISCPVCGQKLWVRDSDAGKRGRCPNCKKAFTLPDQIGHIRSQLALPDSLPVVKTVGGDKDSAKAAMKELLKLLKGGIIDGNVDPNVLKQSTIRVQINQDDN